MKTGRDINNRHLGNIFAIIMMLFLIPFAGISNGDDHSQPQHITNDQQPEDWEEIVLEEEYKAGRMIIEHIIDAHEWHILSIGEKHVAIPLPVILVYEGKLYTFISGKFNHGHDAYKGFKVETAYGSTKGKIVRVKDGTMETDTASSLPLDLSITKNVLSVFFSLIILSVIFISVARSYKKRAGKAPKGLQSFLEPVILFIRDLAISSIGEKKYEKFIPYLLTLFFFILFNNLFGLFPFFPGGANVTGNIAVTLVMAVFTFIITSINGNKNYWKHIFNTPGVPWWLKFPLPLMLVIELMGVLTKPFVLMIRLFANITAGHIIVLGFISLIFIFGHLHVGLGYSVSLVSVFFAVFIGMLELLVAFIQAYVFTLLSAIFFGMATEEHH
ncbi:MAG: F0F1 ATP synthase subunit A [Bacteroidales bacterium]|nr:F0F1 ATP synthase subunit A [Bacteroidales bacterium]